MCLTLFRPLPFLKLLRMDVNCLPSSLVRKLALPLLPVIGFLLFCQQIYKYHFGFFIPSSHGTSVGTIWDVLFGLLS